MTTSNIDVDSITCHHEISTEHSEFTNKCAKLQSTHTIQPSLRSVPITNNPSSFRSLHTVLQRFKTRTLDYQNSFKHHFHLALKVVLVVEHSRPKSCTSSGICNSIQVILIVCLAAHHPICQLSRYTFSTINCRFTTFTPDYYYWQLESVLSIVDLNKL